MKLKRDARTLKNKAIWSFKRGVVCFNGFDDEGRVTTVLLHLQHAAEMILKSILVQRGVDIRNPKTGNTEGVERCLGLAAANCALLEHEQGVIRTIDSMRDAAQHWILFVEEGILYLHTRALVSVFDDLLKRYFEDDLASHLPSRVLPLSTEPIGNIDVLVDREFSQIKKLLEPGRRARDEARGRIRSLLSMEGHVKSDVKISERDIDRVEKGIKSGKLVEDVFPRLRTIQAHAEGEGINVVVRFAKKQGAPVRFVSGDDPTQAAAVREVDLQKKFYMQAKELAKKVGLSVPKCKALRDHLSIDDDPNCRNIFEFKKQKIVCFSDNAFRKLESALLEVDIEAVWEEHRPISKRKGSI
jgi:hypothetical protein